MSETTEHLVAEGAPGNEGVKPGKKGARGRPKRVPDAIQARSILRQARHLMLAQGYGNTTTDDIAAACSISKQTLYRLFRSKQALFEAIIDEHRHLMLVDTGDIDDLPPQEALERMFRIDIEDVDNDERLAIIRLVMQEGHHYPELREIVQRRGGDRSREDLAGWLSRQHRRGVLDIDDPMLTAEVLMDMIFAGIMKSAAHLSHPHDTDRPSHIRRCIRIFLNGVSKR